MPLDPNILLQGYVPVIPPADPLRAYGQGQALAANRQALTLGELGLAKAKDQHQRDITARSFLTGAIDAEGKIDYGKLRSAYGQSGDLAGLAKTQALEQGESVTAENKAQAQERQGKAQQQAMSLAHPVLVGIQQRPELYAQGMGLLVAQLDAMGLKDEANLAKQIYAKYPTYDEGVVGQLVQMTTDAKRRAGAQHVGMTPIYGTQNGQPVVARLTPTGLEVPEAPAGFVPTPTYPRPLDVGTGYVPIDRAGQPSGPPIAKQVEEAKRQEKRGTVSGEEEATRLKRAKETQRSLTSLQLKQEGLTKEGGLIDQALALASASGYWKRLDPTQLKNRARLEAMFTRLGAVIGFDELSTLRQGGGTLGQVTEKEHQYLQSQLAALNLNLEPEELKAQLNELRTSLKTQAEARDQYFQQDFGFVDVKAPYGSGRASPPSEGTASSPALPRGYEKGVITQERVNGMLKALRKLEPTATAADAIDALRSKGYVLPNEEGR